jgi:hypothetical protein
MYSAEPARRVSPATAEMAGAAKAVEHDMEYKVETAENLDELNDTFNSMAVEPAKASAPAVMVDDPRNFAPTELLEQPHRDGTADISIDKLKDGTSGIKFEGAAGVTKGMIINGVRKCTLVLSKFLPAIYDQRDFVSLGEIMRYVVVKDDVLFVYAERTDPSYLYTVPLGTLRAVREDPKKPHKRSVTVSPGYGRGIDRQDENLETALLLDAKDKLVLQIVFNCNGDTTDVTNRFVAAVENINLVEKQREKA